MHAYFMNIYVKKLLYLRWIMIFQRLFYERSRSYVAIASQLFVPPEPAQRRISTFLTTGAVKPCNIARPTGNVTLFPHEEYIIMDCVLRTPQIQFHEILYMETLYFQTSHLIGPDKAYVCRVYMSQKKAERLK